MPGDRRLTLPAGRAISPHAGGCLRPMESMRRSGEGQHGGSPRRAYSPAGRRSWLVFGVVCLYAISHAGSSIADDDVRVRVQVREGQPGVSISTNRRAPIRIVDARGRLEIDGRVSSGDWRSEGGGPFRVVPGGRGQSYLVRGALRVRGTPRGLLVINEIPLEEYVAGTLGAEMLSSWEPDALRAQAVASRTYVLYQIEQNRAQPYDVVAEVEHQRYLGLDGESESTRSAVNRTRGEFIRYAGRPALAAFHSASGGRTASAEEVWGESIPYLRSVAVEEEDDSPDAYWRVSISNESLELALREIGQPIGNLRSASVHLRSPSGRVAEIEFTGSRGRARVGGRQLRQVIGLGVIKSTLFDVRKGPESDGEGLIFMGSGNGHGVGMSQWAAQAMAEKGTGYRDILSNFYPGTQLARIEGRVVAGLPAVSMAGSPDEDQPTASSPMRSSRPRVESESSNRWRGERQ